MENREDAPLDPNLAALEKRFQDEPYARSLGIRIVELQEGRAVVAMKTSESMNNIVGTTHGGAIFTLMDAAFELTVNSHGNVAVALGVNVNYLSAALAGETLRAECREINRSRKIAACQISVTGQDGRLIATCQPLAYQK
jgi:acyl-CoA thioesterase